MVKDKLLNVWVHSLVFLYNFERKRSTLKSRYDLTRFKGANFICISDVSKILDVTNSHVTDVVSSILVPLGLVNVDSEGRVMILSLTEKGAEVAKNFNEVFEELNMFKG